MLIDKIDLYLVENKFYTPWRTAYGSDAGNCVLIVRMASGGYEGWSESSPLPAPTYSYEYGEGAYRVANQLLAPCLIGRSFESAADVNRAMRHIKGNPFAKAGIEMAWWTLSAAMQGVSLAKRIGAVEKRVDVGDGWGICESYDELIKNIGKSFDAGYKRVKLKAAHGWDYDMLAAVRSVFPNQTMHIDCNASYSYRNADDLALLRRLDRFHLAMIEQPFQEGDILSHAKLQAMLDTSLCLDESITEVWQAEAAAELKACRYINIKPARVGGLQNAIDINRICAQAGIGCWIGGMMESDIGKAVCVAAAALPNMTYPHDITPGFVNYPEDIAAQPLKLSRQCTIDTTACPGTPIKPDMERLLRKTVLSNGWEAKG